MDYLLEFEKPVHALENQIKELELASNKPNIDLSKENKSGSNRKKISVNRAIGSYYCHAGGGAYCSVFRH